MNFIKLVKYDICNGFNYCKNRFLLLLIIAISSCIVTITTVGRYKKDFTINYADFILVCFEGVRPLEEVIGYDFNAIWLLIQVVIAYMIGQYMINDLRGYGSQILIRSGSRIRWWISKCIWCVCMIVLAYVLMDLVIIMFTFLSGNNFSFKVSQEILQLDVISRVPFINDSNTCALFVLFVMPVIVSILYSLFQILLSLYVSPIIAFIVTQVMIFNATYFTNSFLVGNYSMLAKYDMTNINSYGIDICKGVTICISVSIIIVIIGAICIDRYDIVEKN